MDYLSVKEMAELWGVSIRMVNYYLNTGRIQGAIRKPGGWLIPANTPHPADLRKSGQRGQERIPPRMAKCYMPLISRPCDNGFQNLLLTMNDEEERDIARAMHHYFRDEHEEAREISEKYLTSKCPEIRLSALITNTMAMLQTGDAAKCRRNLEMIQREGQRANDDSWRLYSSITDALISVFFHSEKLDLTPISPAIGILPPGMQYFAMYAIAHAIYIRREYEHAMGIAESALLMAGTRYPIDSIYLNIVLCMICMSLKQDERAEQKFDTAWSIASREGYIHPFVEHHGILQGQVERALRKQEPETYNKIVQSVYRFSRGWMKIHNPVSTLQVTDALTPYEFSIAMLAAKGRSNKEIAALMGISVNTVKSYMESIFEKLQISSRNEIDAYVNR